MIVRISGEDQYRRADDAAGQLGQPDPRLEDATELRERLPAIWDLPQHGHQVGRVERSVLAWQPPG